MQPTILKGGYALAKSLDNVGVEVVYLPTFCPELNSIELALNKLKLVAQKDRIQEVFARNVHKGVYECLEEIFQIFCPRSLHQYRINYKFHVSVRSLTIKISK